MPDYRRTRVRGACYFFTVVTAQRRPILTDEPSLTCLREAFRVCRAEHPFRPDAYAVLPDHIHALWTLPEGDDDYSRRWGITKAGFTHRWRACGGDECDVGPSQRGDRRGGVWQRRFWEHLVRDEDDFRRHADYIHCNPVRHGWCDSPTDWPQSSFRRWVAKGLYAPGWGASSGQPMVLPSISSAGE